MKKYSMSFMARTALTAAAYAALTYTFAWMSYEQLQFRVAEILVLFVFIEPKYSLGLILGCILANLASPLGIIDVIVGSFATFLAVVFIAIVRRIMGYNKKSLVVASFGPVIANAIFVGLELTNLFHTAFIMNALYVAIGEFITVTIAGTAVVGSIMKNQNLTVMLQMN